MSAEDYRQYARCLVWQYGSEVEVQEVEARAREVEGVHRGLVDLAEVGRERNGV